MNAMLNKLGTMCKVQDSVIITLSQGGAGVKLSAVISDFNKLCDDVIMCRNFKSMKNQSKSQRK